MLRVGDGKSRRAVMWTVALCWLPAMAWGLNGFAARAEQPVSASPQSPRVQPAPARPDPQSRPMRSGNLNVDLDASADYYRGYRDALRDAARMSQPYAPYRGRTNRNTSAYRTWPPSVTLGTLGTLDATPAAARQREAAHGPRNDTPPAQENQGAGDQHHQAGPPHLERRTERSMGRPSDPLREPPQRSTDGRWPPNAAPGAADGRASHPLPMPQSSVPQSYFLHSPGSHAQASAPGFGPADRPR